MDSIYARGGGIKTTKVLAESDFLDAHRQARAKVHIVRFAFNDFEQEISAFPNRRHYKPTIGLNGHDPFQIFIEDELGLKASYSSTTNKFYEFAEKERVRKAMQTEGTASYELVVSRGLLWALLDNYERDLERVLTEYKKISALDTALLQELGVEYDALRTGLKEKLFGFRHVYWSLLTEYPLRKENARTKTNGELPRPLPETSADIGVEVTPLQWRHRCV